MTNKPVVKTLPNGVRLIVSPMHESESVSVHFFVGAGGRYEKDPADDGAAHFIEHLLFKGTHKRPKAKMIAEEVNGVGGVMNAYTTADHTSYYVKLPKKHFELAADILSDILTDPLFDPEELERERKIVFEEMNIYRDDPARYIFDFVGPMLWPESTLQTNVLGDNESIGKISRGRLLSYFNSLYTMDNLVVSIAGHVDVEQAEALISNLLASYNSHKTGGYDSAGGGLSPKLSSIIKNSTNQTHLVLAGRGPHIAADDEAAMKVLATILGGGMSSRLFVTVREEKGLAYDIQMDTNGYADAGSFDIYAGVGHDKALETIKAIKAEVVKLQDHAVSQDELQKAQEQMRGRLVMGLENNSAVADVFGSQMVVMGRIWSIEEILATIDGVTSADVQKAAQTYLTGDKLRLAVIGPHTHKTVSEWEKVIEKG